MKVFYHTGSKRRLCTSAIVLALLLGACTPAGPQETAAPVMVVPPTATVTQTSTPTRASTSTSTPTLTAAPQEISSVKLEQPAPALELAAQSAVLIDAQSGEMLYEKQAHQRMYPASTTKIITALLALEYFKPDEIIFVGEEVNLAWTSFRLDAQKSSLVYRQELSMMELLHGLLLVSGSDAAFVIAVNVARRESGDESMPIDQAVEHFSALMNERARATGAVETNFVSPDGYHDPNHYSTAYDLAIIAQQAMQDPHFREIVATENYETSKVTTENGSFSRTWVNTNRLIDRQDAHYYPSASGIKTGTTTEAGSCLVSSATVKGKIVIAVVLASTQESVWSDSVTLLEYAKDTLP